VGTDETGAGCVDELVLVRMWPIATSDESTYRRDIHLNFEEELYNMAMFLNEGERLDF
jgi:hypothetical protein